MAAVELTPAAWETVADKLRASKILVNFICKNGLWNKWANKIQSKSITEISVEPKGREKDWIGENLGGCSSLGMAIRSPLRLYTQMLSKA